MQAQASATHEIMNSCLLDASNFDAIDTYLSVGIVHQPISACQLHAKSKQQLLTYLKLLAIACT
jgi:hypothetical protein